MTFIKRRWLYIYTILTYMYIIFIVWGPKREFKYFKMRSTKRFVFLFIYLFILFLHTCMFPAWCFRQRTFMPQGLVNGVFIENWTHSCLQFECFSVHWYYKNLFLRKKSSQTRVAIDLVRVEKGEGIPDNTAPKSYLHFLSRTTIRRSVWIRGLNWRYENLSHQKGFVTRFMKSRKTVKTRSFARNKSKIKWKSTTEILQS